MLTDHRPHGDGLVAFGFIRELAARGHELHVAAGIVDVQGALPPNVHLYALLKEGGHGWAERLRFMWRVRRLHRRLTRSAAFDLVHQLTPVDVGVSLALADCSAPLVLGPYVPDWPPSGEGADAVVGPAALRVKRVIRMGQQSRATTVLLSTPAAASKLELRQGPRLHVHELPLGVDDRAWLPADRSAAGQDVLFLAGLEVRKGIHVLLDAFAQLVTHLPDARLLVAGLGAELDQVRRRVRGSSSLDRVELLGHVERDRAMATMQNCDVYCLPSYGDPCPLAAVEAMACARPVVATDAGGLRYLVPDEGGFKVPPGDASALADALRQVLTDPGLARAMGAHNRRVVEERYAWSRVVDGLEDLYGEAIREPRGSLIRRRRAGGSRWRAPARR
jgi:glycosyltransferase involved in cell wall biosynthesis